MKLLGNGIPTYGTEQPRDHGRILFTSFHPCDVLKNVWSQFLAHGIGPQSEISSSHLKDLYELQKGLIIKPVCYSSRTHRLPQQH
ncbi:hypothetical protein HPB48_013371 [Haemaphysalis longicornis]|uniref:Uncharacterized protein n=1 Tax=Haemaphysalis longicornis TaxID=44386 RepID=A0A9J6FST1_HAELO|nr:hypothetical protein HPB48_013371 [Haemaphysalis longicornis]